MAQTSTNIIPKYPQSFTGKTCSPLLHYHCVNHANSCGNAIANSPGLLHAETGFSYFGARYYDSDILTGWLSVDPMADKYPSLSPYAYCAWNPIKLVDPDGRKIKGVKYKNGEIVGYSRRALRNGVKEYIDIRSRTESGRKNIERMLKDTKNTYRIKIVDKPLYEEVKIGKYKRLAGYRYKNTIFISTDYNEYSESVSAVVIPMECGQGGSYETISLANRIVSPDDILELSEADRNMLETSISCYGDIPLKERRRDEAINAIGAMKRGMYLELKKIRKLWK